jgi:Mpv17 / PMP22 family
MIGAGAAFVSALKRRPVLLNSAAGFVLFASSDAFAQEVERHGVRRLVPFHRPLSEKEKHIASEFSWPRLTSAGMLGIFFGGFVYPLAYARLDTLWPGTKFRQVVSKSVAEIFTVGLFVNSFSMMMRGLMADRAWDDVRCHVAEEMPRVTYNDLRLWLPYNLVAFGMLPPYIRPCTTVLMESAWQAYISLRSHDYQQHRRGAESKSNPVSVEGLATVKN